VEAVKIFTRNSYERATKHLTPQQLAEINSALARLPQLFGQPHQHSGTGIRRFGIFFELRIGLKLRVVFTRESGDIILLTAGNHDHVRAWIKENS
jgi:hypothetical protein